MNMWQFFDQHWFIAWCALWMVWGVFGVAQQLLKLATEAVKRIKTPDPIVINDPRDAKTIARLREALILLLKYSYKPRVNSPTYKTDIENHKLAIDNAIDTIKGTDNGKSL